jgi:hypothetical protein
MKKLDNPILPKTFKLYETQLEQIRVYAFEERISQAEVFRRMVTFFFDNIAKKEGV